MATWGATAIITLPNGESLRKRYLKIETAKRGQAKRVVENLAKQDYPEAVAVTVKNLNQHFF